MLANRSLSARVLAAHAGAAAAASGIARELAGRAVGTSCVSRVRVLARVARVADALAAAGDLAAEAGRAGHVLRVRMPARGARGAAALGAAAGVCAVRAGHARLVLPVCVLSCGALDAGAGTAARGMLPRLTGRTGRQVLRVRMPARGARGAAALSVAVGERAARAGHALLMLPVCVLSRGARGAGALAAAGNLAAAAGGAARGAGARALSSRAGGAAGGLFGQQATGGELPPGTCRTHLRHVVIVFARAAARPAREEQRRRADAQQRPHPHSR